MTFPRSRFAITMAALVACTACRPSAPREIRVGVLALLHSELAVASGIPSAEGAQLAAEEINARGGVPVGPDRFTIRLVLRDYAPRPDAAATEARALINIDSVDAIIGPQLSAHALPAGGVAEDAHVPLLAPMASNPAVTAGRHYVFRLAFTDPFQGEMLARYARDDAGARRAAVLYDIANPYGRDIAALFKETFERLGGAMVATETFTSDQRRDFTPALRRIAAAHPDVLLLPNYSAVDTIQVRQARALGIRAQFLASDTWDPAGVRGVADAEGTVVAHQWSTQSPRAESRAFVERYRQRFGVDPRSTAAMTYDAVFLLADAVTRAGSLEGEALRNALASTTDLRGVTGVIRYNGTGDPQRSGVLSRIGRTRDSLLRIVDPR
jgi:branched-chain amino acid transport system substrate-binding protein